jgi:hypothetical protein
MTTHENHYIPWFMSLAIFALVKAGFVELRAFFANSKNYSVVTFSEAPFAF